jgi:hypothetical protein
MAATTTLGRVLLNERSERRFSTHGDWRDGDEDRNRLGRLIVRPKRRTEVGAIFVLAFIILVFLFGANIIASEIGIPV